MPKRTRQSSDPSRTRNKRVKSTPKALNRPSQTFDQISQQIIASVQHGVIVYDRSFKCRVWNPFMEERSGLRAPQVLGKSFLEIMALERRSGNYALSKESIEKVQECQRRVLAGETITHVDIPVYMRERTETRYSSVRYDPLRDVQGEIFGVLVTVHDTTERKRAEGRLRESERQLAEAQQIARVGSWNWDIRANVVTWSDELFRIFGLKPQERIVSYETFINYVHPDDRDYIDEINREAMENHNPFHYDYRIVWDDGTVHRIHADGEVILDEEKRPIRMHGTSQDITNRKLAEERLQRSEDELRKILTNIDEIVYSIKVGDDPMASTIQFMSPRTEDIVGYRPEEFTEDEGLWFRILHPADVPTVMESTRKILEDRSAGVREYRLRHKGTGQYRWLEDKIVPQVGESGKVIGIFGVARDITERKRAEDRLKFSQFSVNRASDAAYWMTPDGRIFDVNESASRSLGYTREELLTMSVFDIDPDFPRENWSAVWSELKRRGSITIETRHRTKSGRIFPVEINANFLEFGGKEYDCAFARDITERKRAEEELSLSVERLNEAQRIGKFGYLDWTLSTNELVLSDETIAMYGLDKGRKRFSLEEIVKLVHPEDKERVEASLQSAVAGTGKHDLEHRMVRPDGKTIYIRATAELFRDHSGKPVRMIGTVLEITERKRAEEALRESEERFRASFKNAAVGMGLVDRSGRFVETNRALSEITGYSEEDLKKLTFSDITHPDDRTTNNALYQKLMEGKRDGFVMEKRYVRKDGAIVWITLSVGVIRDRQGHITHTIGLIEDITERKRAEAALHESQRALSTLLSNLPGMVYRCRNDKDWTVEFASGGCLELTGYQPSDLTGRKVSYGRDLIHRDDQEPVWDDVQAALREKRPFQLVYRIITAGKKEKWVAEQGMGIFSPKGDLLALEGFITDISERRQAEEELKKSEAQNRALLNAMPDMMFRINREGIYLDFIPAKGMVPFVPPREFLAKSVREVLPSEVAEPIMHYVHQALDTGETQIFEYPLLERGNRRDYEARIVVSGKDEILAIVRDITERKTHAAALEYQALHDTLTDLPNRTLVLDRLRQAIHAAGREGKPLALLLMDLDRFKDVNDALGHHHGDLLLKQVGPRVLSVLRESDTIARLGGDEFAVLLPSTDIDGATVTAQKILEALDRPFVVEGFFLEIGASIGIALFPEHGEDVDMLMRRADVAMYSAKQSSSGYAIYISEHDRHSPRRLALMGELRHAIERQEFILYYQPKVDLKTRRTIGVEALIRWKHPQHGLIPPDDFIVLAEHTGFIKQLTFWVLSDALRQWRVWRQSGIDLSVAVNLSARNLQDLQLPDQFAELFRTADVAPRMLELEITESAIMADPSRAMEILTRLRSKNIRFSIDDFGAGYSSLGYLKKLPIDAVKVDKSFVLGMAANADDAVIVRSTIDLAHNLGLKVFAEGVESREVLDRLIEMGCDAAQGYYLSRPIPAEELTRWLTESPWGLKKT